ncbi:MAG: hypothetical protein AABY07_11200 [Nanoarchaeota archaeon]
MRSKKILSLALAGLLGFATPSNADQVIEGSYYLSVNIGYVQPSDVRFLGMKFDNGYGGGIEFGWSDNIVNGGVRFNSAIASGELPDERLGITQLEFFTHLKEKIARNTQLFLGPVFGHEVVGRQTSRDSQLDGVDNQLFIHYGGEAGIEYRLNENFSMVGAGKLTQGYSERFMYTEFEPQLKLKSHLK